MRVHLLAPPNAPLDSGHSLDGFVATTIKFSRLLKELGHTVFVYAGEGSIVSCDELVTVVSKAEQKKLLKGSKYQYAGADNRYPLWELANKRTIAAIESRKQPRDFICTIGGTSQQAVTQAHPELADVEYSIGYAGSYARHRVFESHAWRYQTYGKENKVNGNSFDEVIPLFYDPAEFKLREKKEPFALFVGRLTHSKGITTACQAAENAGIPLKVIGHGDRKLVTHGAKYLGALSEEARNDWMSRASVLLCPTIYTEPFGGVAVEAQLCGTPVVSTNYGAFSETIEHGRTGFRCAYLGEFSRAILAATQLDPFYIRERAVSRYSLATAGKAYARYFDRLKLLWDEGWNTVHK